MTKCLSTKALQGTGNRLSRFDFRSAFKSYQKLTYRGKLENYDCLQNLHIEWALSMKGCHIIQGLNFRLSLSLDKWFKIERFCSQSRL